MSEDTSTKSKGLKFKDPGIRDTVVRKSAENNSANGNDAKPSNPILDKIKHALNNSDPAKWEKYGETLDLSLKQSKAYERWEVAYCIDLPNGLLTFRHSQPVNSEYFGGGYSLSNSAPALYTIELRPRSWDPRTLIDPFFRSTLDKDKQYKQLADGDVAKDLFGIIQSTFISFNSQKKLDISESIQELANNILDIASESTAEVWEKADSEAGLITFSTMCGEIKVSVMRAKRMESYTYALSFSKDEITSKIKDYNLAKDLFTIIEDKHKNAALEALQNVLDEAGF